MAHALVMQVNLSAHDPETQTKMLNEIVVPAAKAQDGFQRAVFLHEGPNGLGLVFFDTAEQAKAAGETLGPPPGGPVLISSTIYEVTVEA